MQPLLDLSPLYPYAWLLVAFIYPLLLSIGLSRRMAIRVNALICLILIIVYSMVAQR